MTEIPSMLDAYKLKIVFLLAISFVLASGFGYIALRIKASPILGYLLAGYFMSPYSPGFVADIKTSEQLAEIGVILMMFGVGLDFRFTDLFKVKNIAIPGAILQITTCVCVSMGLMHILGWPYTQGMIIGLAIGVASTVVLVRMLQEYNLTQTKEGHISVGWLIVEDILTVIILLLLPMFSLAYEETNFLSSVAFVFVKIIILSALILRAEKKRFPTSSQKFWN